MPTAAAALAGIRIVDLSRVLAGPLCTQLLADHGADVIKVEPPGGDETRGWGPPFVSEGTSAYFAGLNRNKRNIALDLRSAEGQAVLARLLAGADVLVENFKAGTLARWGFGDDRLRQEFPRLVHCRITGFGVDGPRGATPGYDAILQAYAGLMSVNGEAEGPALRVGVPIVDMVTGILSVSGILLALSERERSGRGQLVDNALLDTAVSLLHPHSATWLASGTVPERTGSAHPTIAPYDTFTTRTGPLFLGVGNDRQFRSLVAVLGRPSLADDHRFASNPDRVINRAELSAIIGALLAEHDREDLRARLLERGVPSSPVHDVGETLTDPQVLHRGMVVEHDGYRGVGNPIKLTRTPATVRIPPRDRGADTREVLRELGYDDADIDRLTRGDADQRSCASVDGHAVSHHPGRDGQRDEST
ncbi:CaiB/BaiF CoA transferase family protein [Prauserella muralis]|uniref:CaiB/BaiF CoA transferase family protein n=1 Tax=Prauserella muralis TaxID=588067 RepID=UPI0011AD1F66|nr:CoA transferase [Prauserella muralis]TWE23029.1 crotonobetainyl-CoA:carnitine CoA-transferase CaiB-like acyl-CoA transferase [Prauserella muralis]